MLTKKKQRKLDNKKQIKIKWNKIPLKIKIIFNLMNLNQLNYTIKS